jgi:Spy/CpxP family protein refolding chaperone
MSILSVTRRTSLLVLFLGLFAAAPVFAQRGPQGRRAGDPAERLDRRIEHMDQKLNLSDEQETEIRRILEQHMTGARAERGRQMRDRWEAADEAVRAILTPEQKEIYAKERGNRGMGMQQGGQMEALNLTSEQREQLQQIREGHRQAMEDWKSAHPDATREEIQAYRTELHEQGRAALQGVLTPEQLEKMDAMKSSRGDRRGGHKHRR